MTYGGSVPTITARYSGFVNGDPRLAHHRADLLDHGHLGEPGRKPTRARAPARPTPTTRSPTSPARCRSTPAPLSVTASSPSSTLRRPRARRHGRLLGLRERDDSPHR